MDTQSKTCTKCLEEKPLSAYRMRKSKRGRIWNRWCNVCLSAKYRQWAENKPDKIKTYRKRHNWTMENRCARRGITPEELMSRYEKQSMGCAICLTPLGIQETAIDHNHRTGEVRGILCLRCNSALGGFKDSPTIITSALEYLNTHGNYGDTETPYEKTADIIKEMD